MFLSLEVKDSNSYISNINMVLMFERSANVMAVY